jgi:hypothetical protein
MPKVATARTGRPAIGPVQEIRFPEPLRSAAAEKARAAGLSFSAFVREAVAAAISAGGVR